MVRAERAGIVRFEASNPREFATDAHRSVDDSPYGGGPGMVMRADVVGAAIESLSLADGSAIVWTEPSGERFTQSHAWELAQRQAVAFVCGHYEGIDERARELYATHTFSVGEFILTGGELPAMLMADATVRLLPGVLGGPDSLAQDCYVDGLLSYPQYTRPAVFKGEKVPAPLLSGDHAAIQRWRRAHSLQVTRARRPDLFAKARLRENDLDLL